MEVGNVYKILDLGFWKHLGRQEGGFFGCFGFWGEGGSLCC